ncbi:MAG: uroporphyrinogen-III C-methyltransferase [Pseudomonadota bacterium]
MTDPQIASRSWPRHALRLLLVAALGGGVYALYHWVTVTDGQIGQLMRDVQRLEAENADTARIAVQDKTGLANLTTRFDALEAQAVALTDTVQGGRLRVQAASAELLLTAAAERVQIGLDPASAVRLLDLADRRLAAATDARLSPVRKALAEERVALLAVPAVDREGITLLLAALIRQSPQWPLQAAAAPQFESPPPTPALPMTADSWAQRAWHTVRQALSGMFSLRRDDRRLRRVLGPEQETLLRQILMLKLEGARLALLRSDGASFRDFCASAAEVLAQDFRLDAGVSAAQAELERLARLELNPPLPETGRALRLLREFIDAR